MICPKCGSFVSNNLDICPFCNCLMTDIADEDANTTQFIMVDEINKNEGQNTLPINEEYESAEPEDSEYDDEAPKSRFDPNAYPVLDPTELPAYKIAQEKNRVIVEEQPQENAPQEKEPENEPQDDTQPEPETDSGNSFYNANMEYDEVTELNFEDEGPEFIGQPEEPAKVIRKDKSTFAVGAFFKDVFAKIKGFFGKLFGKKDRKPKIEAKTTATSKIYDTYSYTEQQYEKPISKKKNDPAKKALLKKIFASIIAVLIIIVLSTTIISIAGSIKNGAKNNKELFPAVYFDSGKLVLLDDDDAQNRTNIASSGVEGVEDVQYYRDAKRVFYVKNSDFYTYSLKSNEKSMRIIRNVNSFACFDNGKKAIACAQDGKIYYFNGKVANIIAKDNSEPGMLLKYPFVMGEDGDCAIYLDKYNGALSTAEVYKIDGKGKTKMIAEIQDSASDILYYGNKYLVIVYTAGYAEIYDNDGSSLLDIEDYASSIELGGNGLLIGHKDGSVGYFDGAKETILDIDIAKVISISENEDSFVYCDPDNIAYLYKDGENIEISDTSYFKYFAVDMDTYKAYAIEDDVLTGYVLKSNRYKEREYGDGVEGIVKNERTGQWTAYGFDSLYIVGDGKMIEIYSGSSEAPFVSHDGKKSLVLSKSDELILKGKKEKIVAEDIQTYYCDDEINNILFVKDDKLYCNSEDNKIANLRDAATFEIVEPMD